MIKCPRCYSERVKLVSGNTYTCTACGTTFDANESQNQHSRAALYDRSRTSSSSPYRASGKVLSGEELYNLSIKSVAEVRASDGEYIYSGTAFVISNDGILMTNSHVVRDNKGNLIHNMSVTLDGEEYPAKLIFAEDMDVIDIAIIKIYGNLKPLPLGDSNQTHQGEKVYAIGNSLGEGLCITCGIVSDLNRKIGEVGCIMADVATNHGNSGGPLFDECGRVIAVCVAGIDGAQGMRYFIPINAAVDAVKKYLK